MFMLVLLKMRNISGKVVKKTKPRFVFSKFFSENLAVYETMWKKYGRAG
jgi:hypothetical protein